MESVSKTGWGSWSGGPRKASEQGRFGPGDAAGPGDALGAAHAPGPAVSALG